MFGPMVSITDAYLRLVKKKKGDKEAFIDTIRSTLQGVCNT